MHRAIQYQLIPLILFMLIIPNVIIAQDHDIRDADTVTPEEIVPASDEFLAQMAPSDVRLRDIAYGDHARQMLDVYMPPESQNPPLIFMVHGGGYVFGDKFSVSFWARYYVTQGYAVVAPNYRLAPAYNFPAQIEDVMCALAWALENAPVYGYDTERIVLAGESAGANAVTMLGVLNQPQERAIFLNNCAYSIPDDFALRGVVALYAPVDLSTCDCIPAKQMAAAYLGLGQDWREALSQEDQLRDVWQTASPLPWLDGDEAPFLLIHGTADELVGVGESVLMANALQTVDVPAELHLLAGAEHGFITQLRDEGVAETLAHMSAFLRTHTQ
jgi:acetyl esterase/lipase